MNEYNKSTLSVRGAHKHKSNASRNREYMSLDCNAAYYLAFGGLIIRIENVERTRMGKIAKPLQNMNIIIWNECKQETQLPNDPERSKSDIINSGHTIKWDRKYKNIKLFEIDSNAQRQIRIIKTNWSSFLDYFKKQICLKIHVETKFTWFANANRVTQIRADEQFGSQEHFLAY